MVSKLRNSVVIHCISKQIKIAVSITDWYQSFSTSNEVGFLLEAVRDLYQQQSEVASSDEGHPHTVDRIRRDDLKLMCYEYIYA
jgi:hypothetical protein